MPKPLIIGANQESIQGPGTLTHEGGDTILIADLEGGLPGDERSLVFEGEEVIIDGDDEFQPSDPSKRSTEIGEAAVVRSLGQANASFEKVTKLPKKKEAEEIAA